MVRATLTVEMDGEEVSVTIESALDLLAEEKRHTGALLAARVAAATQAALR